MKKLFFILSAIVLLYSCSGAPERGNYIPKSAKAVVTINTKGIVDEIKWDILFGGDLFKFKNVGKDAFVKQLMEDPTKTGVEFMERTYVFFDSAETPILVAIIPLNDADAFAEFLTTKGDTVVGEGDFQAANSLNAQLVWNSKTAFYVSGQKDIKQAVAYVTALIDNEKSGLLSTEFKGKTVLTGEDHIAIWVNSGEIQKALMESDPAMAQMMPEKPEKSEFTATANFQNGKLAVACDQYFDEKSTMLKVFQKQSKLKDLALAADINKAMVSMGLTANMKALAEYMGQAGVKDMVDMLLASTGLSTDALAMMLDGDIFVSFDGLQMRMEEKETYEMNEESGEYEMGMEMKPAYYPTVVAGLSIADTAMMKQMVNRMLYNFAAINKEGIYSFGPGKGFLFFKEKNMFYVSDSAAIATIMSGKAMATNDILNDNSSVMTINLKDVTKKLPLAAISPDAEKVAKQIEASIEGIKLVSKPVKGTTAHSEFELNAVNKEENILISILKLMKALDAQPEA
jgi:hypothetical protein